MSSVEKGIESLAIRHERTAPDRLVSLLVFYDRFRAKSRRRADRVGSYRASAHGMVIVEQLFERG